MPRGSRIALLWVVAYLVRHGLLEPHDKSPMQMLTTNPKRELYTLTASAVTLSAAGQRPGARLDLGLTPGRSGNAHRQSPWQGSVKPRPRQGRLCANAGLRASATSRR